MVFAASFTLSNRGKKGPAGGQSKEAKMKAATAKKGGKKKKWSKGKARDSLANAILLEPDVETKLRKEVPGYKLITVSVVSDRMKVNGSLARRCIAMLHKEGLIKPVIHSTAQLIYTRATAPEDE